MRRKLAVVLVMAIAAPLFIAFAPAVPGVSAINLFGAACSNPDAASRPAVCNDTSPSSNPLFGPSGIFTIAIGLLSLVIGVLAVFVVIISGIRMSLSSGDPNNVKSARNTLIYALIGLLVAATARLLVVLVLNKV